jgi:hypothetical protein
MSLIVPNRPARVQPSTLADFPKAWAATSLAELNLAPMLAVRLQARTTPDAAEALENLACWLAEGSEASVPMLARGLEAELASADIARPFPATEDSISSNLFSVVVETLAKLNGVDADLGVVATPPALAMDMVDLAGGIALEPSGTNGVPRMLTELCVDVSDPSARRLQWHDPCVGGGVFPVAILFTPPRELSLTEVFAL